MKRTPNITRIIMPVTLASALLFPFFTSAAVAPSAKIAPRLEISGWVPYWRVAAGTTDAIAHIDVFTEISPLGFTVNDDGTLLDRLRVASTSWQSLINIAQFKKVRVMPTITWNNGEAIDAVLRDPKLRAAHIAAIMNVVAQYNFDGIDIDYEGKKAETKNAFSLFLRDLYKAMGKKFVTCSIEARTPLDSRFTKIPANIQYANDFAAINKYCDRVRLMAYDQGPIDLKLNKSAKGIYQPIADPKWVRKVVALAAKEIAKKKIVIGIPTYGREYVLTPRGGDYEYKALWSFDENYALDIAEKFHITPTRNSAGELHFLYSATTTPSLPLSDDLLSQRNASLPGTTTAMISTAATTSTTAALHLLWWSDAQAIRDKVLLARELGVRGVSIFKIDGGEDKAMWGILR